MRLVLLTITHIHSRNQLPNSKGRHASHLCWGTEVKILQTHNCLLCQVINIAAGSAAPSTFDASCKNTRQQQQQHVVWTSWRKNACMLPPTHQSQRGTRYGSLKAFSNWSLYPTCKPNNLSKISLSISPILPNSAIFFFFFFFSPSVLATKQKRLGEAEEWGREWTGATQFFFSFWDFLLLSDEPSFLSFTYFLGFLFSFYHSLGGGMVACTRRIRWDPQGTNMTARRSAGYSRWDRCRAGIWFFITSGSGYLNKSQNKRTSGSYSRANHSRFIRFHGRTGGSNSAIWMFRWPRWCVPGGIQALWYPRLSAPMLELITGRGEGRTYILRGKSWGAVFWFPLKSRSP